MASAETHEILNQSPPIAGLNLFSTDPALGALVEGLPQGVLADLIQLGASLGTSETFELGPELCNSCASPHSLQPFLCFSITSQAQRNSHHGQQPRRPPKNPACPRLECVISLEWFQHRMAGV